MITFSAKDMSIEQHDFQQIFLGGILDIVFRRRILGIFQARILVSILGIISKIFLEVDFGHFLGGGFGG